MSNHCAVRIQQRGIRPIGLHMLELYGKETFDHHGARILYFDKQSRQRLEKSEGKQVIRKLDKLLDIYAVIDIKTNVVITAGHNYSRKKNFH